MLILFQFQAYIDICKDKADFTFLDIIYIFLSLQVRVTLVGSDDFVGIDIGAYNKINEVPGNKTKCVLVSQKQCLTLILYIKNQTFVV